MDVISCQKSDSLKLLGLTSARTHTRNKQERTQDLRGLVAICNLRPWGQPGYSFIQVLNITSTRDYYIDYTIRVKTHN
ncbi:hypothetical protein HanRHA438_Chr03g0125301 [Helianthus annuus]|nr:hypothetical protein HanRHA438_Chr03g0125301 [Helianthus annuus]